MNRTARLQKGENSSYMELGAAIIYNPDDYMQAIDDSTQYLLVSKPSKSLETWITAASAKDQDINTMEKFIASLGTMFSPHY